MMTEVCEYLHNWFDRGQPKIHGSFVIADGTITDADGEGIGIKNGQYYRVIGSALNDGVWRLPEEETTIRLTDETFDGSVWLMAVPPAVVALSAEIDEWNRKYGAIDSPMMSPYQSESFDGYSYSKASGGTLSNGAAVMGWQNTFGSQLARWKKL